MVGVAKWRVFSPFSNEALTVSLSEAAVYFVLNFSRYDFNG